MTPWTSVLAPEPGAAPAPAPVPPTRGPAHRARRPAGPDRRFWIELGAVTLVGFGIRLGTVLGR
ncbi:MAG TPA: hypothetical protein VMB72_05515, partial [Acidimicrobiales bacterium]|nr:hypothetical protein [Acidimicrobiales bacterium]